MKRTPFLFCSVLLLFFLSCETYGNVIKAHQWIYSYKGDISTSSSACNKSLVRWTVSGDLTVQSLSTHMIFKLDNVKTSLFNGKHEDLQLAEEKEIPNDSKQVLQPFIVKKDLKNVIEIYTTINETLWSLNIKRSIVSNFEFNFEKIPKEKTEIIKEKSIFGECEVEYEKNEKIITKIIQHETCQNKAIKHQSNVKPLSLSTFNPLFIQTTKNYTLKNIENIKIINEIKSISNITYKSMSKVPHVQRIIQHQEYKLTSTSTTDKIIIDKNECNIKKDVLFDFGDDYTQGRHEYEKDQNKLVEKYIKNYEAFDKKYENLKISNHNIKETDYIESMYMALFEMNETGINNLQSEIIKRNDRNKATVVFFSILPYIGKNHTVKYIADLFENQLDFESREYFAIKLLTTFPFYIENPTEELIKRFEFFMNLDKISFKPARNTGILSFASIIATGLKKNMITKEIFNQYVNIYFENFIAKKNYEDRLIYLLGLINLMDGLNLELILSVTTNSNENHNIRSLAITGFKNKLINEPEQVFENFWPVVQNKSVEFDVRVSCLDLLLSTNLTEEQFNSILNVYKEYQNNINDMHLANYFYSSLMSIENITAYVDPLGSLAATALKTQEFPYFKSYMHAWTTGNYRFSYSDSNANIGNLIQTRLIANPKSNAINTIHLSYNSFAFSFDMGTYSLYLKMDNLAENYFQKLLTHFPKNVTVPELLKLLNDFNIEMKEIKIDFNVEIIIFVDNRAVFSTYICQDNSNDVVNFFSEAALTSGTLERHINFPLMDYTSFPSDLGTTINIMNDKQEIIIFGASAEHKIEFGHYWSYQTWLESYNPLSDTTINSYKYYGDEKSLNLNLEINLANKTVKYEHQNDSFIYLWDKLEGTTVDDANILQEYCPKCDPYYEIKIDNKDTKIEEKELLGIKMNYTSLRHNERQNTTEIFETFKSIHQSNSNCQLIMKPVLIYWHVRNYIYYFHWQLSRGIYRSISYYEKPFESLLAFSGSMENKKDPIYPFSTFSLDLRHFLKGKDRLESRGFFSYLFTQQDLKIENKSILELYQEFRFVFMPSNITQNQFMVCGEYELHFDPIKPDKYSIQESSKALGKMKLYHGEFTEEDSYCPSENVHESVLKFSTSKELIEKVKRMTEYEECEKDSKDFKFIQPTETCRKVQSNLLQLDRLEVSLTLNNETQPHPVLLYSTKDFNKLTISLFKPIWFDDSSSEIYYNYTTILPFRLADLNLISHNDIDLQAGLARSCIITTNFTKTFTEKVIRTDENKPIAFIDCYDKSSIHKGMTIKLINNKNIGFTLWIEGNILEATVEEEKLQLKFNTKIIKETFYDEESKIKIKFLDENVFYIIKNQLIIYYNTETISIKVGYLHNYFLCGQCSSENEEN